MRLPKKDFHDESGSVATVFFVGAAVGGLARVGLCVDGLSVGLLCVGLLVGGLVGGLEGRLEGGLEGLCCGRASEGCEPRPRPKPLLGIGGRGAATFGNTGSPADAVSSIHVRGPDTVRTKSMLAGEKAGSHGTAAQRRQRP